MKIIRKKNISSKSSSWVEPIIEKQPGIWINEGFLSNSWLQGWFWTKSWAIGLSRDDQWRISPWIHRFSTSGGSCILMSKTTDIF